MAFVLTPHPVLGSSIVQASSLVYLCHRRQDLVAVATSTEGVADVVNAATVLQGWSEDWYVTDHRPAGYVPPTASVWHARVDHAPLSVDLRQAGYQPSVTGVAIGDRRRVPMVRTRVIVDWWPIYVEDATGTSDALAKAKSRWVDPIYSAGHPMTLDEWVAYTGFRHVKPSWFDPTPVAWAGLDAIGGTVTITWRVLPVATNAPYDASIKLPSDSPDDAGEPVRPKFSVR